LDAEKAEIASAVQKGVEAFHNDVDKPVKRQSPRKRVSAEPIAQQRALKGRKKE
jgi:hypothetical protein